MKATTNINTLRKNKGGILIVGSYPIVQSILDYEYLSGKKNTDIVAILRSGKKKEKFFFGDKEILIPLFASAKEMPSQAQKKVEVALNLQSGRSTLRSAEDVFEHCPNLSIMTVFAESVPEKHALLLKERSLEKGVGLIGPASVGLLIPGVFKMGAIGGVTKEQIERLAHLRKGNVAVITTSGGMANEVINSFINAEQGISFALSCGGDRFSLTSPIEAMLCAQKDSGTKHIAYLGELGGIDEQAIASAIKNGDITKPVHTHIAGDISDSFEKPIQFGHSKAFAKTVEETAAGKRKMLKKSGAITYDEYSSFISAITTLQGKKGNESCPKHTLPARSQKLVSSRVPKVWEMEEDKLGQTIATLLLGKKPESKEVGEFIELIFSLLADHGPHVSGATNTIVSARAGKDMVSSIASGLLTIGPRFGGAINGAANVWKRATEISPKALVQEISKESGRIPGIGHLKYSKENPDARVAKVLSFQKSCKDNVYSTFARDVEEIMLQKNSALILNVDGAVAAMMLDILSEKEKMSKEEIEELIDAEFFNALFILPRTIGFAAHYIDQRKMDEGLFRMPDDQISGFEE